jgi:triacylglycerol lipase
MPQIQVRALTDTDYSKLALLIMYAWDMCDQNLNPTNTTIDPRILADGWKVIGIITGGDNIAVSGDSIRQQFMTNGDVKRYGYLAVNVADSSQYVAVIRGTDGAEEWEDDFDFIAASRPPFKGNVESGFADIYQSMQYYPMDLTAPPGRLADAIAAALPKGTFLTVLGHSLGSSLGTLLAYELADPARLGTGQTGAVLFASPKTGDHDFVDGFAQLVTNYIVIDYEDDIVPDVPPFDVFHLDLFRTLPFCRILTDTNLPVKIDNGDKGCCHHLICYIAELCDDTFKAASKASGWTTDDGNCAKCVSQNA